MTKQRLYNTSDKGLKLLILNNLSGAFISNRLLERLLNLTENSGI